MAGFEDVLRLHLQPSALTTDPAFAEASFRRDLDRFGRVQRGAQGRQQQQHRADFERDLQRRHQAAQRGFRTLTPREQRYTPPGNPNQYMIDAILRDNAIAQYQRDAPRLRQLDQGR